MQFGIIKQIEAGSASSKYFWWRNSNWLQSKMRLSLTIAKVVPETDIVYVKYFETKKKIWQPNTDYMMS